MVAEMRVGWVNIFPISRRGLIYDGTRGAGRPHGDKKGKGWEAEKRTSSPASRIRQVTVLGEARAVRSPNS